MFGLENELIEKIQKTSSLKDLFKVYKKQKLYGLNRGSNFRMSTYGR